MRKLVFCHTAILPARRIFGQRGLGILSRLCQRTGLDPMWCRSCQQDVPAVADPAQGLHRCCARCGSRFDRPAHAPGADAVEGGESFELLPDFVEQKQGDVQQLLDRTDAAIRQIQALATAEDRDAIACAARARVSDKSVLQQTEVLSRRLAARKQPVSSLPWLVLGVGLSVFVCGAILTAWALLGQRPELWSVGVPLLVAGQVAVFAVIIWQFESIWRSDQATFHILHGVDERLQSLRPAAGNAQRESSATELRLRHDASHSTADTVDHWLAVKNELDALRGDIQSAVDQDR